MASEEVAQTIWSWVLRTEKTSGVESGSRRASASSSGALWEPFSRFESRRERSTG